MSVVKVLTGIIILVGDTLFLPGLLLGFTYGPLRVVL